MGRERRSEEKGEERGRERGGKREIGVIRAIRVSSSWVSSFHVFDG
jgi:hypothetical protein